MDIDEALVRRVAQLARLELTAQELRAMAPQLQRIFDHVDRLQELELDAAPAPTQEPADLGGLREDVGGETLDPRQVLDGAPDRDGAFFVVPGFLDPPDEE